jgi:hypothetical protein
MNKKFHWRFMVLRWHRRIGLVLSIFLLWMLASGVLLNHSDDLLLSKRFMNNTTLLKWYGVVPPPQYKLFNNSLSVTTEGLWLGQQNLGSCAKFLGVATLEQMNVVVCAERIVLLSNQSEVIDQIDELRGLKQHFDAMSQHNQTIFLKDEYLIYQLNTDDLSFSVVNPSQSLSWFAPSLPSKQISLERVLLDAHSGRLLGGWGKYLVDAFAAILFILLISGWWLAKKRHKI